MKISIRQLTIAGVLGALMIVMGLVGTGLIPVPNLAGAMTLMHIPIIIGAVVAGPVVGFLLGIIFAVFVSIQFGTIFPLYVLIPGRLLIGPIAWFVYDRTKKMLENKNALGNIVSTISVILVILIVVGAGFYSFNINQSLMNPVDPKTIPTGLSADQTKLFQDMQGQITGLQASANALRSNGYMMLIILGLTFLFVYLAMSHALKQKSEQTSITLSSITGTLTNSIITLGLGVVFPTALGATVATRFFVALGVLGTNTTIETVLAVTACIAIIPSLQTYYKSQEN